jgi:hypothetical protein
MGTKRLPCDAAQVGGVTPAGGHDTGLSYSRGQALCCDCRLRASEEAQSRSGERLARAAESLDDEQRRSTVESVPQLPSRQCSGGRPAAVA